MNKRHIGNQWETKIESFFKEKGYQILEKNWYSHYGEIDIIALIEETVVFIEVKYRKNNNYGYGSEAVNRLKQERIYKSAMEFLQEKNYNNYNKRFDVISVIGNEVEWLENSFWGGENGF